MNEYYEHDKNALIRVLADLMDQIPAELEEQCKTDYTSVYSRAKTIFVGRYMPALPYIGGRKNPHTNQLIFAAAFAAIHDVFLQHHVDEQTIGQLCLLAHDRYYARFYKSAFSRLKKRLTSWFGTQKLKNDAAENTLFARKFEDAWVYEHSSKNPNATHEFTISNCGVERFCKSQGLDDLLPYLCEMDYRHFANTGLNCTKANCKCTGDETCVFLVR